MTPCRCRTPTWLLVAAAAALAGGVAYALWPESPAFAVEQPDRVFEGLPVGQTHRFSYRVTNLSSRPIRVVGAEFT